MRALLAITAAALLISYAFLPDGVVHGDEARDEKRAAPSSRSDHAPTPRVFAVRHVDAGKLGATIESVLGLWKLGGPSLVPAADGNGKSARAARIAVDSQARKLTVAAESEELLGEISKLIVLLDRDPRLLRARLLPGAGGPAGGGKPRSRGGQVAVRQFRPGETFRGKEVHILDGAVPLKEFLHFLADYKGIPVLLEEDPGQRSDATITVAAPIRNADDDVVEALLEASGWFVEQKKLPGGKEIIRISRATSPGPRVPESRPIIRVRRK